MLRPLLRRAEEESVSVVRGRADLATAGALGRVVRQQLRRGSAPRRARRHDAGLRELDVPAPRSPARQGPPAAAAAERVGVHGDVDVACATLSAAWPHPPLTSRTSSRPACAASSAESTRAASRPRRTRTSRTRATTSGGCSTTRLHAAAARAVGAGRAARRSDSASRTPRTERRPARAISGAATSTPRGSSGRTRAAAARDRVRRQGGLPRRVRRAARARPAGAGTLGATGLFVLPSTSPANAAVPTTSGCTGSARCASGSSRAQRAAVRAVVVDAERPRAARALREPGHRRWWWATPGGGIEPGETDEHGAPARAARGDGPRRGRSSARSSGSASNVLPWRRGLLDQRERFYLVRVERHDPSPTIDLVARGHVRTALVDARASSQTTTRRARSPPPRASARGARRAVDVGLACRVHEVIVIVHLLAAMVWVGGSVALVFAGVPAIRVARGRAARQGDEGARPALAPARLRRADRRGAHRRRARQLRLERGPLAVRDGALGQDRALDRR